ncbi:unnamed protein product [Calicophoron daubneyi]|uniref:HECT-type E3 ubiquitin transferase n=1 Tax=Calicophoron daubneyi TaxID=300641 RepID=A0AAV2TK62_CALDB
MLLAKRLSECPDESLIAELKKVSVWNYGKCELGLWADVLDRLDAILERAVTKVGRWTLLVDTPENASLVSDVVTILEFTGHLIEHSIYRYLYGSWSHILALFGSENMDILLAVLGLSYNFSKRSNYFIRLDPYNKKMVLDRLVSIAETWGGVENNFGLAACCDPNHFPESAGNIYFEYRPEKVDAPNPSAESGQSSSQYNEADGAISPNNDMPWTTSHKIVLQALHLRNQSPSQIMEELLAKHPVPVSKQMALFSRVRLATYFANPEQRHKCIRARLQALSILSYTFEVDERHLYPSLVDELVEVLELPEGQFMGIKACALRTMTAIVNSHRLGVSWASLVGSTGLSSYNGILPKLTRRWIQGLVDGTIEAPGGSTNQQFTTALLSFLYHLACYEENVGHGNTQNATLSASGVLDTMLQLIGWHTSRNDCLSYVTRAVRVTDQILMSISSSRQHVVEILVERLKYEVDLVLKTPLDAKTPVDSGPALNTQRSGLMKSMLNLLKRLCLDTEWGEVMQAAMDDSLPTILRRIFLNGSTHFTPHLALFAMETITNYLYTYPSRISSMQDKHITTDILKALTDQPLPQNRDFLVQLPGLFNTLALNSRGIGAIRSSGVLTQYLDTLVSPEYLPTMKTKRVRDFLSQISYNLTSSTGQSLSNSLTASQMSNAIQELLRSHNELKPTVFQCLVACLRRVVELGNMQPASLVSDSPATVGTSGGITSNFPGKPDSSGSPISSQSRTAEVPCVANSVAGGGRITSPNTANVEAARTAVMLEEDVVMLSGGEDEEDDDDDNDIDDVQRATRNAAEVSAARSHHATSRVADSCVAPPREFSTSDSTSKTVTILPDGSSVPPYAFLSDFLLNTCKFLEKLLPSVLHVTEAMCRHFVSYGGLQVLCDLLRMPGLPYDFPVSAACASLCKIFEDLANSISLTDVIEPLFQCLESSMEKLSALRYSHFTLTSLLLREYLAEEHTLLHELVVTASIICILVQVIDHLKPELRPSLAAKWIGRNLLSKLGHLYLGVSWEAGVLLKIVSGDKEITSKEIYGSGDGKSGKSPVSNLKSTSDSASGETSEWKPVGGSDPMPQFVEALHIYSLLKPSNNSATDCRGAFLQERPDVAKATHRILHVTAFLINSVTELCTAWGRFFANRNQVNYRRRRMTLLPSEQIPATTKYAALSQVAHVLSGALGWQPASETRAHPAAPKLIFAMRYASVRLASLLLHDPNQKGPQGGMMNAFFMANGLRRYFGLFNELLAFDLTDPKIQGPLTEVLEEWLACADRISSAENIGNGGSNEFRRPADSDAPVVDMERYVESVHQNMLFPLEQLCLRSDLQNLLSKRAVEHLLSMLVAVVPYLFNTRKKEETAAKLEESRPSEPAGLSDMNQPDSPAPTPTIAEMSSETIAVPQPTESIGGEQQPQEQGETESANAARNPAAIQLMEEMGFSRELALVALEQTGWDTNEAVNLVIATSAEDLLASAVSSDALSRLTEARRAGVRLRRDGVANQADDGAIGRSAAAFAAAALELASASSSLLNLSESVMERLDDTIPGMPTPEVAPPRSVPSLSLPMDTQTSEGSDEESDAKAGEPLSVDTIEELRESLKHHVFRACYSIAKRHHSDQILHRIAELLLSSGEEERYIDQLFGFVGSSMSARLGRSSIDLSGTTVSTDATLPNPNLDTLVSTKAAKEYPTVGLHLSALLFTRCQALCARLAWNHSLPGLLIAWISSLSSISGKGVVTPKHEPMQVDVEDVAHPDCSDESESDYYKTLLLASLILDQYERSVQAMHLRQASVKLYLNARAWNWFDDRAVLWHPYTTESARSINTAFHQGELCAYCHISRRPYAIEFPTMTQVNLDIMHRRPILLFPDTKEDPSKEPEGKGKEETAAATDYEKAVLEAETPPGLSPEQRQSLFKALLGHFENISKSLVTGSDLTSPASLQSPPLIPSDCVNAMLRLLLRLAYSSYDDANGMADANFLSILLNYPHTHEFSSEYSAFVGALLCQIFDDAPTVKRVMKEVIHKMCQFGVPSAYMGIGASANGSRDLFYLLSMCTPLFAKDRETACKLACENVNLSITDADVQAKTLPKSYVVEIPTSESGSTAEFSLSTRQINLLTQLIELILRPQTKKFSENRHLGVSVPISTHSYMDNTQTRQDNDIYTSMATGAPTLSTSVSPVSSSTTTTWASNLTVGHLPTGTGQREQPASDAASTTTALRTPLAETLKPSDVVVLGRADAIRYLIDLIASYQPVAEFLALYKHRPLSTCARTVHDTPDESLSSNSLLTHLFNYQLSDPETTELTISLLENLILMCCESTQGVIISEYKSSLNRISTALNVTTGDGLDRMTGSDLPQLQKNERITAHMLFLERLLALPSSFVNRLIRLIYRRHLPADIAKLIALVDCNLPNTQSTLGIMLRTLESLTWVDRQINKLATSVHDQHPGQNAPSGATTGSHVLSSHPGSHPTESQPRESSVVTTTNTVTTHVSAHTMGDDPAEPVTGTRPRIRNHPSDSEQTRGRTFESDSDEDDDDEDNDVGFSSHGGRAVGSANAPSSSAALNLVFDDVIVAQADVVLDEHRDDGGSRQAWHAVGGGEQDGSVIFVRDDEDEGSAGQGAEAENSQEDDDVLDDDEDEEEDVAGAEEDHEDDDEDDEDDDDDNDDDVSGEDEEVAFVLRGNLQHDSGGDGSHIRGPRRHVTEATISVSGSRDAEIGQNRSASDGVQNVHEQDHDDLAIHNNHEEDDGSFEDDEVGAFDREFEDLDDVRIPGNSTEGAVFLSPEGRILRSNNSVVAMVEEVLNLVDVPHQLTSNSASRVSRGGRLAFSPGEFTSAGISNLNIVQSGGSVGNWGLLLPRFSGTVGGEGTLREGSTANAGFPSSTTIFRFGLGNGGGASVYVTGGGNSRFSGSGVHLITAGNGSNSQLPQPVPPPTLASQHPLLQIPSPLPSTVSGQPATTGAGSNYAPGASTSGNVRLGRTMVTSAGTTSSTSRLISVLPPPPPPFPAPISGVHYSHRSRAPGGLVGPVVVGSSGVRQRGPPTRLYSSTSIDSPGFRSYSPGVDVNTNLTSSSATNVRAAPGQISLVRDNRSGPEADALVWSMLTSLAEDQPSAVNSALASVIFSQVTPSNSGISRASLTSGGDWTRSQLSPYAGYALPSSYRRWISLSRMLFGHEIMDLMLISRHHVYEQLAQRRCETFKKRLAEAERLAAEEKASAPAAGLDASELSSAKEAVPGSSAESKVSSVELPSAQQPVSETSSSQPEVSSSCPQPMHLETSAAAETASSAVVPEAGTTPSSSVVTPETGTTAVASTVGGATSVSLGPSLGTVPSSAAAGATPSSSVAVPRVPMTDEETIQSLVEGGMDPSFLDALPEDMRREVIADHRHARQVQQQLSSLTLPEHINPEWLAGLPTTIQEEVLSQIRAEQQPQQQQRGEAAAASTAAASSSGAAPPAPESNTAFLISLPTSLRREVLADMEESQLEMLPSELAAEARQLRRENEERYARAVQGGILSHSFNSRTDQDIWRNLTTASGLIGGHGRWDVRFSSINQFLRHLNSTLGSSLSSNTLVGLQNTSGVRGRHLVDHEGLTCLIALLVASSSCSQQRRHIVPFVRKVLGNLSCHPGTRNWVVGTLLTLFDGLSEKYDLDKLSSDMICEPSGSTKPAGSSDRIQLHSSMRRNATSNSIFHIGFEAALGCWVRIFHPLTRPLHQGDGRDAGGRYNKKSDQKECRTLDTSIHCQGDSVSVEPAISQHHHIIHPQAAVSVASVLLETLSELARVFPFHFYPHAPSSSEKKESVDSYHPRVEPVRPSFWEIFDRLCQSPPVIGTTHSSAHTRSGRRSLGAARKRQSSLSAKHSVEYAHVASGIADPATLASSSTETPMDTSCSSIGHTDAEGRRDRLDVPVSPRRKLSPSSSSASPDCFTHLADLLCHPLLHDRPLHQERILSILAGIVKEFIAGKNQSSSNPSSSRPPQQPTTSGSGPSSNAWMSQTNQSVLGTGAPSVSVADSQPTTPEQTQPQQQSSPPGASESTASVTRAATEDTMEPLRSEVVRILCQLVLAPKSTETARSMAAQLITDLARANRATKETMLRLLSESVAEMTAKISKQLKDLIDEIDEQMKSGLIHPQSVEKPPIVAKATTSFGAGTRTSSFDILPDRFSSGQVVVISSESRSNAVTAFSDLQLKSMQVFSCPNDDQSRLRATLGLMLRLAAGDSSVSGLDPIPVSPQDIFQDVPGLKEFWPRLSEAFEKLHTLPEPNAVLLLQPLLEAFCLAHLYLVKDSILIRQRSTSVRSSRGNSAAPGSSSLSDMVPVLQLRVEAAPTTSDRSTCEVLSSNELQYDVMGPLSPPSLALEDEKPSSSAARHERFSVSSASGSNAILEFAELHRTGLNQVLRQHSTSIGESPFAVFLAYPRVLDFDIKRRFFRQQLQSLAHRSPLSNRYDDEPIVISRDRIFEDSYARLHRKTPTEWKHKFVIRFQNEEGQDAGGPLREWYLLMSREIFNPNYCLFRVSPADRVTYTINPSSYINSNHLSYFKFVGRFIAKAIYDNKLLECYFSRSFYKHILGVPVKCSDLESEDYEFYKGLEFLLRNHVSDLGYELTFSTEINEFGKTDTRDLIENGRNVAVTEQNKREYVRLVCQERMTGAIRQQLDAFLTGFYDIIPKRMISIFNEQELELLISGLPNIDIADLKANTTYSKYQPNSPQIEWFWRALESFDQEDRARFLQFVTGTSKVPLGGFANLEGMHGPTKFQISRATVSSTNHLPCAHTCFNTLVLPAYEVYEQLRSRLLTAIRECSEGYGMA